MHNPRLGVDIVADEVAGYMNNLGLAHPKQIDVAVPGNMRCGRPEDEDAVLAGPDWAPLTFTFAGFWEIQPHWVEEHRCRVQIVDVREPDEYGGALGRIAGSLPIPLGKLARRAGELSKDRPIVTVCRAGARSAQAVAILKTAGFQDVANLAGGLLRWRAQHLPVEGAVD
ncbi:MAG: hypothetical protein JSU82_01585 [Rhodospirillales bacterium]|nr:MAG: hypothetical protein JSU82_01585 [Rhodospirillales bacterium]